MDDAAALDLVLERFRGDALALDLEATGHLAHLDDVQRARAATLAAELAALLSPSGCADPLCALWAASAPG